jgi:hypothetical protein
MNRISKRFRSLRALLAVAALALAVGALGIAAGAVPAGAATSLPVHASIAGQPKMAGESFVPDIVCHEYFAFFTIYRNPCTDHINYNCAPNSGTLPYAPGEVSSGCDGRVWIYQGPGKTGYSLCISPDTATGTLQRTYTYMWAGSNTAPCS